MPDSTPHADVTCPYCHEVVSIALDPSGGVVQEYIEDCQVCCRPWQVLVIFGPDGSVEVSVTAADDP